MELFFIRHGESAGDPFERFEKEPADLSGFLTERGRRQAEAAAERLVRWKFEAVYVSPLGRAMQTAQHLTRRTKQPLEVLDWLREWMPHPEFRSVQNTKFEELERRASAAYLEDTWCADLGENVFSFSERVVRGFLNQMSGLGVHARYGGFVLDEPGDERRFAFFAHGGTLTCLTAWLIGMPIQPHHGLSFECGGAARCVFRKRVDVWYPEIVIPSP